MPVRIALLRGINVGGKNRLPMKDLKRLLESLGAGRVQTYIQSGNAVFQVPSGRIPGFAGAVSTAVAEEFGFEPGVVLLDPEDLEKAVAGNPFPRAACEPMTLHLFFLGERPAAPDLVKLEGLAAESERFRLVGRIFYLHAPDGIGRSRLASGVEKALGVAATARNWRTVLKLLELSGEVRPFGGKNIGTREDPVAR
ncbi:MAG: DUF1697 domain-containing protein [Acidobacteriota bacterium]